MPCKDGVGADPCPPLQGCCLLREVDCDRGSGDESLDKVTDEATVTPGGEQYQSRKEGSHKGNGVESGFGSRGRTSLKKRLSLCSHRAWHRAWLWGSGQLELDE